MAGLAVMFRGLVVVSPQMEGWWSYEPGTMAPRVIKKRPLRATGAVVQLAGVNEAVHELRFGRWVAVADVADKLERVRGIFTPGLVGALAVPHRPTVLQCTVDDDGIKEGAMERLDLGAVAGYGLEWTVRLVEVG